MAPSMDDYNKNADTLFKEYENTDSEQVHQSWRHLLPEQPGLALDVGAGSGRDSAWLKQLGWEVIAAEPASALRERARRKHGDSIQWVDDKLPELGTVRALNLEYRLILVSAVFMHLPPSKQERAFRVLSDLLAPGGVLVISLRSGPTPPGREFHPVNPDHLRQFASRRAVDSILATESCDALGRPEVSWRTLVFRMPDDGTGGLPTLRNIIVNDNKSATYKLGLLRALVRAADGSPGLVLSENDEKVTLPFGLVALNWLKLYLPLIGWHHVKQTTAGNPGFARGSFHSLANRQRNDLMYYLRPGMYLEGELAQLVPQALNHITDNIQRMPAHYITWPGGDEQIFSCSRKTVRARGNSLILNRDYLAAFGEFHIPRTLWRSMAHHACWLEPAINHEWVSLMKGWDGTYERSINWHSLLDWEEARRDTKLVRNILDERLLRGEKQACVWSATSLRINSYEIDHCLPWSRWYNNDLWNLLPATRQANNSKREKLPSIDLMLESRPRILDWWESAYQSGAYSDQFQREASASLPVSETPDLEEVFNALLTQRIRLKVDQQIQEWSGYL